MELIDLPFHGSGATIDKDHWLMLCYPFSPIPTDAEFLECLSCP
jgi:hypothetical protein